MGISAMETNSSLVARNSSKIADLYRERVYAQFLPTLRQCIEDNYYIYNRTGQMCLAAILMVDENRGLCENLAPPETQAKWDLMRRVGDVLVVGTFPSDPILQYMREKYKGSGDLQLPDDPKEFRIFVDLKGGLSVFRTFLN